MKKFFLLLVLFSGIILLQLHSQTIVDTLEMAYSHFSKRDYKTSAVYFDYFLSKVGGQTKDYYLAGVCHANMNEPEKSLEFLNKSANGKAEYYMMLNDPELKPVQPQIKEIVHRFDEFELLYQQIQEQYPRYSAALFSADSLYQKMPAGKVSTQQLKNIAWDFLYATKDTVKFYYYLGEQLRTNLSQNRASELVKDLEIQFKTYKNKIGLATKDKLLAMGFYRYFYAMTFMDMPDSLRYHLSKVPYEMAVKLYPKESYLGAFEYFAEQGRYDAAFSYLYSALAKGAVTKEDVFKSRMCNKFFKNPAGKKFLVILLSESLIPTIESSDRIFIASAHEYASSCRQKYDFLKAMNFKSRLPELKNYLISKSVYGAKTASGKMITVSESYPYGLYEDDLKLIIDSALSVKPLDKDVFDFFSPPDEVVLVKNTPLAGYAYTTGEFYRQPVENIPFILSVKNGKIKKSQIPSIRQEYFSKLVYYGMKSVFYDKPDRDAIRYFAFAYGYHPVEQFMDSLMRATNREDVAPLSQYIHDLAITHTYDVDFLIHVFGNPEQFMAEDRHGRQGEVYNNLERITRHFVGDLTGSQGYASLHIRESRGQTTEEEAQTWKDASAKISAWWEQYKKANPYPLPVVLGSSVSEQSGMPEHTRSLMLTASNKLLFYNPSDKEITSQKRIPSHEEEVSIVVEEMNSPRSSGSRSDISGTILGDTGYIFSPNHRDRPANLSIVPSLTERELNSLKEVYENLNLTKDGRSLVSDQYDKSYDKFYVYRYNKQLVAFWFSCGTLHATFVGPEGQINALPPSILFTREMTCAASGTPYSEMIYNVNSLQFERVGPNLLVVCNVDIKEAPACNSRKSRVYVELLGPDLKPLAEQTAFSEAGGYDSDPSTFVKATPNNIYVLAQSRKSTNKVYGTVFTSKLAVADTFMFDQNIGGSYEPDPLILLKADGDNVYCLYSQELHGDVLLCMSKTGPKGTISKPLYIYRSEGSLTDYKAYFAGGNLVVYLIENSFQKERLKKITLPVTGLKFGN